MKPPFFVSLGKLTLRAAILLLALFAHAAVAAPTSQEQARSAVNAWRSSEKQPLNCPLGSKVLRVLTQNDNAGNALYHVVFLTDDGANARGLVVVAADDEAEPVIAISSGSDFAPKPGDPLKALLNRHVPAILKELRKAGPRTQGVAASAADARAKWTRLLEPKASVVNTGTASATQTVMTASLATLSDVRVAPLVQSMWNQTTADNTIGGPACYNYYTPPFAAGNTNNYYCGCVATAVGQIMRFWQYPTTSVGTASFPIQISDSDTNANLRGGNGSGGAYQWASMPLSPTASITTPQAQAIGALMYDVALTANMDFTSNGSSGYLYLAVGSLVSTFHYSNGVDVYASVSISTPALVAIINPDLDAGCPVCIAFSDEGGHALVCDGYGYNSGTLYHHLNFGWGGDDDVWYALPTANTDNGDFSTVDEVSFNIFPTWTGEIISGRVTDNAGNPLVGANISATISGGGTYTAVSGTHGIYAIKSVPPSSAFTVSASYSGYAFTNQAVTTGNSTSGILDPGYSPQGSAGSRSGINFAASAIPAAMQSPANNSTLTSSSGTFIWSAGSNVSEYWLSVGNTAGATDIFSAQVSGTSTIVTLPADGRTLYVKLWSMISGAWQSNSYTYTAFTAAGPIVAQILTPANTSAFTSTSGTFTWTPGTGVSEYWLTVGSTPGGSDIHGAQAMGTSATLTLPGDGRTLYVALWSLIYGEWEKSTATYTAVNNEAMMTSPGGGTTLGSANVPFNWSVGPGVTEIWMTAGSTPAGTDLFTAQVSGTSQSLALPTDGRRIYVKLWSLMSGVWKANAYTYNAFSGADPKAELTSPAGGSTFPSGSVTFNWSPGTGVSEIWLCLGSEPGAGDHYSAQLTGSSTTLPLPVDGRPVYATLWSRINGVWGSNQYVFTAATQGSAPYGLITSPVNGGFLNSGTLALNWSAGTGVSEYWLSVGSTAGAGDLYSAGQGTGLSKTVQVPLDGRRIYVELWTLSNGTWKSADYFYDTTE